MVKRIRREHYGRNPRHHDWERQSWPAQVQNLAQRVFRKTGHLFGIANDLSWTTSEVVRSVARVEEDYEPERRTPAEIRANFNKQYFRILQELERLKIPYEVVPRFRLKQDRSFQPWSIGVRRNERKYEPFYLGFSEYLGTELPGHDTDPHDVNRNTAKRDRFGFQLDLHYIDEDGDVYFGEIKGPWKMKMEFTDTVKSGEYYLLDNMQVSAWGIDLEVRGWTPIQFANLRPWQDINDPAFVEGHGRMIWKPIGPVILFPKPFDSWAPISLNYP